MKQDLAVISRRVAKLVISSLGSENRVAEYFAENDMTNAGILSTSEVKRLILNLDSKELKKGDVATLLKELDSRRIGAFCLHSLSRRIIELAQENTLASAILRRVLSACTRKGPPLNNPNGLKQAFIAKDGKVNNSKFKQKLLEIVPGLIDTELKLLEEEFSSAEAGKIDLKKFIDDLFSPDLRKATLAGSDYKKQKKESMLDKTGTQQALKGKLEELKKDNDNLKKENNALYQRIAKMEKVTNGPRFDFAQAMDKSRPGTGQSLKQYSAKIGELEKSNYELQKNIDTECKPLIEKLRADGEKLKSDIKFLKLENLRLQSQLEKFLRRPMDGVEKQHELDNLRDTKISEQERKMKELTQEVQQLEEKGFTLEQEKLELQFEKENFDLERSRLERRIKDLEQFQAESK